MRDYQRMLGAAASGGISGGGYAPRWLWYESFATAEAAPLAASSAANPGPGTTHYGGTTGSKSGGNYVEDVAASNAGPYQNTSYARGSLACVAYGLNYSRLTSVLDIGFAATAAYASSTLRPGLQLTGSISHLEGAANGFTIWGTTPLSTGVAYDFCTIATAVGGFTLYRLAGAATWTLLGFGRNTTTDPIYARVRWNNAAGVLAALGLAASVLAPPPYPFAASGAQGVLTLPAANFILGLRLSATTTNGVRFRWVDALNHFRAERTEAGALRVVRVDAGVDTVVVTSAMTAAINDRLYLRLEGNTCRIAGHPTTGTWVNPGTGTLTQHTTGLGIEVLDEAAYDSLEIYPLTGHVLGLPLAA